MRYNFCYKYYKLKVDDIDIILELSYDNTLGAGSYGAHTNTLFKDTEGDLGHAAGVGKTEIDAVNMCLKEVMEASNGIDEYNKNKLKHPLNVTISDLKEINLPYRVSFVLGSNKYTTIYFKKEQDVLKVLTDKTVVDIPISGDVIQTLEKHIKLIKHSEDNNFTKEYLQHNNFYPIFKFLTN